MKGFLSLTLLPLLAAATPVSVGSIHNDAAPILSSSNAEDIPDSYIVVFKKHVNQKSASAHHSWVQDIHTAQNGRMELKKRSLFDFDFEAFMGLKHTFHIAGELTGYAGHFHEDVIEQVRRHPDVSTPFPLLQEVQRLIKLLLSTG
jgi:cerevisin